MNWTAAHIYHLLERRYADCYRWVLLREVAYLNSRADAVLWHCFPSDGMRLTVFEIKVDRSDFLRERKDPMKNYVWRRDAAEFFYVAPEGVILPGEVPPELGWLRASPRKGGYLRMKQKPAGEVEQKPLNSHMISSLLRSAALSYSPFGAKPVVDEPLEFTVPTQLSLLKKG